MFRWTSHRHDGGQILEQNCHWAASWRHELEKRWTLVWTLAIPSASSRMCKQHAVQHAERLGPDTDAQYQLVRGDIAHDLQCLELSVTLHLVPMQRFKELGLAITKVDVFRCTLHSESDIEHVCVAAVD